MKYLVTGHRLFKLQSYDIDWIKGAIEEVLLDSETNCSYGIAGMASGVDLWFCSTCLSLGIPFAAYIPFKDQYLEMEQEEREYRDTLINQASEVKHLRNSSMVESADAGIVVWDASKGGTHNVVQQMVEASKPFIWINPVSKTIWPCFPSIDRKP